MGLVKHQRAIELSLTSCPDFPNNSQFAIHFKEFLYFGYRAASEAVECKFPHTDGSRTLSDFSVGIVDGQTKVLIMVAIAAFCDEMQLDDAQLQDPALQKTLSSLAWIRCSYQHFTHPGHHFLHSLSGLVACLCVDACHVAFCVYIT